MNLKIFKIVAFMSGPFLSSVLNFTSGCKPTYDLPIAEDVSLHLTSSSSNLIVVTTCDKKVLEPVVIPWPIVIMIQSKSIQAEAP